MRINGAETHECKSMPPSLMSFNSAKSGLPGESYKLSTNFMLGLPGGTGLEQQSLTPIDSRGGGGGGECLGNMPYVSQPHKSCHISFRK